MIFTSWYQTLWKYVTFIIIYIFEQVCKSIPEQILKGINLSIIVAILTLKDLSSSIKTPVDS